MKKIREIIGDEAVVLSMENISVNYLTGDEVVYKGKEYIKEFSITNVSKQDVYYDLALINVNNDLKESKVKMAIQASDGGFNLDSLEFPENDEEIAKSIKIPMGMTQRYKVVLSGDKLSSGEALSAKIYISENDKAHEANQLASLILTSNEVNNSLDITGLIKGQDDLGVTYYFHGNVENNYVSFANYNWRIVRITGDNRVKLILDEDLEELFKPYNDNESFETISEAIKLETSDGLKTLNAWYVKHLQDYDEMIALGKYVSETATGVVNSGITSFTAKERLFETEKPSLVNSGVAFTSKIGLISGDELFLAGVNKNTSKESYLYNEELVNGIYTYSPYSYNENTDNLNMIVMTKDGKLSYQAMKNAGGLRPVIIINDKVKVNSGTGVKDDPYIIDMAS